jgi:hypothetical protein
MNTLVFDIETIPDTDAGRRLHGLDGIDDREVADMMFRRRREETGGSEFLRHHFHRIVAISVLLASGDKLAVWSLCTPESDEAELVRRFFEGIDRYTPQLVSWNGRGFDLPVLHYRALQHGIAAPRYWETGADDASFKWNNYLNRFHERHTDLMDVLAGYEHRAVASLQDISLLLGFPGKLGMAGAAVWDKYLDGGINAIRDYCETDVMNTWLVWLRFQLMRGRLTEPGYKRECERLRKLLETEDRPHHREFLAAWK